MDETGHVRTSTVRADQIQTGSIIRMLDRDARVISVELMTTIPPIAIEGPAEQPREIRWVKICYQWVEVSAKVFSPVGILMLEGMKWIYIRTSH